MLRIALCALAAVSLAACDTGASGPTSSLALAAPIALASASATTDGYVVSESVQILTEGDVVILQVNGESFELGAGEAYLAGQALSRAGYRSLDPQLAEAIRPPRGGDKCEPPPSGSAAVAFGGLLYGGGGKCPPPPPPLFMDIEILDALYQGNARLVEIPEEMEWKDTPAGFVGDFR